MNDRRMGSGWLWLFAFWFIWGIVVLGAAPAQDEPSRYATEQAR